MNMVTITSCVLHLKFVRCTMNGGEYEVLLDRDDVLRHQKEKCYSTLLEAADSWLFMEASSTDVGTDEGNAHGGAGFALAP